MNKIIKEKFPEWTKDLKGYSLCLTDDIDSLFSCIILQNLFNAKIELFYNFNSLYMVDNYIDDGFLCGVDMDLIEGKCFGNHVTRISKEDAKNEKCGNLNTILDVTGQNYTKKYGGSTLLTILSLYNVDISELSEECKLILLSIDSAYLGYYYNNYNIKNANKHYLCNILEFEELYNLQKKYSKADLDNIQSKYNLKGKIWINQEGKLTTDIKLEELSKLFNMPFLLPKNTFDLHSNFNNRVTTIDYKIKKKDQLPASNQGLFSCALTYTNKIKYSTN